MTGRVLWMIALAGVIGCADATTAPVPVYRPLSTVVWSAEARALVSSASLGSPPAARLYAIMTVAQRVTLERIGADTLRTSPQAAIGYASARVLTALLPSHSASVQTTLRNELRQPGVGTSAAIAAGKTLGELVADSLLSVRAGDSTALLGTVVLPTGPGVWASAPGKEPVNPRWGEARPWLLSSGDAITVPPPPAFTSTAFQSALAEVRRISDTRTEEQLAIARYWALGSGTPTPPGWWNGVAADLCVHYRLTERQCATTLATMHQAMMDAGIVTWVAKYRYLLARPYQMDPAITQPVEPSNHPSYPSAHSTYSSAAGVVLGWYFPREKPLLDQWVHEANVSRIYGGVHYRFDGDQSDVIGRQVGALFVASFTASGLRPYPAASSR